MIPTLDVRHDMGRLIADLGLMKEEILPSAVRALNKALTTGRAEGARELGADLNGLPIGEIKKRIVLARATRSLPKASLTFSNKKLRLFNWKVGRRSTPYGTGIRIGGRMPKKVLRVDAITGDVTPVSQAELARAFIQRSRRGAANIWLRQTKHSMPIDILVTPSLSEILVDRSLHAVMLRRAGERFAVVFAQEGKFRLSKRSA